MRKSLPLAWLLNAGLLIHPDMSHFKMIRPCGISDKGVTSLERLLGYKVEIDEVSDRVASTFAEVLGVSTVLDE